MLFKVLQLMVETNKNLIAVTKLKRLIRNKIQSKRKFIREMFQNYLINKLIRKQPRKNKSKSHLIKDKNQ